MTDLAMSILTGLMVFVVLPLCVFLPPFFFFRMCRSFGRLTLGDWVMTVVFAFLGFGIFANIVVVLQSVGVY